MLLLLLLLLLLILLLLFSTIIIIASTIVITITTYCYYSNYCSYKLLLRLLTILIFYFPSSHTHTHTPYPLPPTPYPLLAKNTARVTLAKTLPKKINSQLFRWGYFHQPFPLVRVFARNNHRKIFVYHTPNDLLHHLPVVFLGLVRRLVNLAHYLINNNKLMFMLIIILLIMLIMLIIIM
jgi:hypothetical protein